MLAMRATLRVSRAEPYLGGDIKRPVRDVEVPYNENEEGHLFSLAMEEK